MESSKTIESLQEYIDILQEEIKVLKLKIKHYENAMLNRTVYSPIHCDLPSIKTK